METNGPGSSNNVKRRKRLPNPEKNKNKISPSNSFLCTHKHCGGNRPLKNMKALKMHIKSRPDHMGWERVVTKINRDTRTGSTPMVAPGGHNVNHQEENITVTAQRDKTENNINTSQDPDEQPLSDNDSPLFADDRSDKG
jgi:hypothetical protein